MIWLTSDLHLFHNRDFVYKNRGFENVEEMNSAIEANWNALVGEEDEVYILGDLMVCGKDRSNEEGMAIVRRLKGKKHIILGNHDTKARIAMYEQEESIVDVQYATMFHYKGYDFYLSHFPSITTDLHYEDLETGIINFFGHTHTKEKFYNDLPFMYNVSVDAHENRPVSIDEALKEIKKKYQENKIAKDPLLKESSKT